MSKDFLYPLRRIHGFLHEQKLKKREIKAIRARYITLRNEYPRVAFLVFTPAHGNLGDHAIAQAEKKLLQERKIAYIEITGEELHAMQRRGTLGAMNGFPIIVHGGGYLGTIWMAEERLLRDVIRRNRKSVIFSMPNTVFYENTNEAKKQMKKSVRIYGKHKQLYLCARENASYQLMCKLYKNVLLIPDVVLSLSVSDGQQERKGCLLCLREDREKTRTKEQETAIRNIAETMFGNAVFDTDMILKENVSPESREKALEIKYKEFAEAELVITDRLHGMIFSAITGTPCIVIDSKSPKVRGCYEWIKDLNYIQFVNNPEQILESYNNFPKTRCYYSNEHIRHYYVHLLDELIEKFGWE